MALHGVASTVLQGRFAFSELRPDVEAILKRTSLQVTLTKQALLIRQPGMLGAGLNDLIPCATFFQHTCVYSSHHVSMDSAFLQLNQIQALEIQIGFSRWLHQQAKLSKGEIAGINPL